MVSKITFYIINLFLLASVTQGSSTINEGVGLPLDFSKISASDIPEYLKGDLLLDINSNPTSRRRILKTHDFNGDNVPDKVVCHTHSATDNGVEIFDGVTGDLYYSWQVGVYNQNGRTRQFRGCSIANVANNRPAIFFAGIRSIQGSGMRGTEVQWVLFRNNKGAMELTTIKRSDEKNYIAAARNVTCTDYPHRLLNKDRKPEEAYTPGALCFYAGYDSNTPNGYGTLTALVKIEYDKTGAFSFKDLTAAAGLRWVGGMMGTNMNHPNIWWEEGLSNNLSMMDGVFIDYDRDGYTDLATGGAHSNSFMYQMVPDHAKAEGFRFRQSANFGREYVYRMQALNETEKHLDSTCFFVADGYDQNRSYLRCYKNGNWIKASFAGDKFDPEDGGFNALSDGNGNIFFHVAKNNGERFYKTSFKDNKQSESLILRVLSDRIRIFGFTCRKNDKSFLPRIALTSKRYGKEKGYKIYQQSKNLTDSLNHKQTPYCLAKEPGSTNGRIFLDILKSELASTHGSIWVHMNSDAFGYSVKELKYSF